MFENKTILVTGGTGTFGQKFAKISLNEHIFEFMEYGAEK